MTTFESPHFRIETLAEGVYAALASDGGGAHANSAIIDLGDSTILFDTTISPQAGRDLVRAAQLLTGRQAVDYAVNSHHHRDHIRGNFSLPNSTIVISGNTTRDLMATQARQQLKFDAEHIKIKVQSTDRVLLERNGRLLDSELRDLIAVASWQRAVLETIAKVKLRLPDVVFQDHLILYGSRRRAELISFRGGHCACDTVLFLPNEGIAFLGDLLYVERHPNLSEVQINRFSEVYTALQAIPAERLVPGHGPVGDHQDLQETRTYFEKVSQMVKELAAQGLPIEELIARARPESFRNWRFGLLMYENNLRTLYQAYISETD